MDKQAMVAAIGELSTQVEVMRQVAGDEGSVLVMREEVNELAEKIEALERALSDDGESVFASPKAHARFPGGQGQAAPEVIDAVLGDKPGTAAKREIERMEGEGGANYASERAAAAARNATEQADREFGQPHHGHDRDAADPQIKPDER